MVNETESITRGVNELVSGLLPEALSGYEKIIVAILIFLASIVVAKIVYLLVEKYFKKLAAKTKSRIDDELLRILHKPIYYVVILIGVQIAVSYLLVSTVYGDYFTTFISIILIALVTWVVANIVNIILQEFGRKLAARTKTSIDDEAIPFLSKVAKFAIYAIALMIILDQLGIEITPLIASLGIAGFAIGFAAKDTIANLLAGFFILSDRPFARGDRIKIGNYLGEVVDIGLRSTKIETLDHTFVVIPNEKIISNEIINYALPDLQLKVKIPIGVAYGSDIEKVKKIVLDIANASELILDKPAPCIFFREFGESSLNFLLIVWVDNFRDKLRVMDEINSKVYEEFDKEGIEIPFPCRTVYLRKDE